MSIKALAWWRNTGQQAIRDEEVRKARGELSSAVVRFEEKRSSVEKLVAQTLNAMHREDKT